MEKNAVYIGKKWLPYRKTGVEHFFTVHSVFDKVFNLNTDQGLLSVAAEDTGASSSFLAIPGKYLGFNLEAGQQCVVRAGILHLAGHTINFKNSACWKGPINKKYRYTTIKSENIAAFKAVLDRKAAKQSAWRYIHDDLKRFAGLAVIHKLRENPHEAEKLIGLGQGLTPSGDDMLAGFLAMVNHSAGNKSFIRALHSVVSKALHKTADISAEMLANALSCDYHEYIQNCIRDLCEGQKEDVYISAAALLGLGASSGSDIACGMYFGMREFNVIENFVEKQPLL